MALVSEMDLASRSSPQGKAGSTWWGRQRPARIVYFCLNLLLLAYAWQNLLRLPLNPSLYMVLSAHSLERLCSAPALRGRSAATPWPSVQPHAAFLLKGTEGPAQRIRWPQARGPHPYLQAPPTPAYNTSCFGLGSEGELQPCC